MIDAHVCASAICNAIICQGLSCGVTLLSISKRKEDFNGWWEVENNPITKVGVYPYLGKEIGAPEPDRIYHVYRSAEELQKPETIESFRLVPFVDEHEIMGKNGTPAEQYGIQGVIGERVYYDEPYIRGNLRILSDSVRGLIDSGKIELSAGYYCKYDFSAGEWNGQKYDAVQRDIRANHLALVQEGRTGADVCVQDRAIITIDTKDLIKMNFDELLAAIAALSEDEKAQVIAQLSPATDDEQDTTAAAEAAESASAAASESGDPAAEAAATAAEAATATAAEASEVEANAESPEVETQAGAVAEAAAAVAEAGSEVAEATVDELKAQVAALQKQMATQDQGAILKAIAGRDNLASSVSRFVGTFDHAAMTSQQVAEYGVKKLGIKCSKGHEAIALDAWMQGRTPESEQPSVAMDGRVNSQSVKSKLWS